MGYILLYVENLAVALLALATLAACLGRLRARWLRAMCLGIATLAPFAFYGLLAGVAIYARMKVRTEMRWLYPASVLLLAYVLGAIWILRATLRRRPGAEAPPAAAWPRGRLLLFLAVAVALHGMTFWNLDLAAKQQLAELRSETAGLALSAAPARPPDHDNAALLYERAFGLMKGEMPEGYTSWFRRPRPGDDETDTDDAALRAFLKENAAALDLLREAADKPACYFEHDYYWPTVDMILPELANLRQAAQLLALDARCRASDGDLRGALRDVYALSRMAEQDASPFLIGALVTVRLNQMAVQTFEEVIAAGTPTEDDLKAITMDATFSCARALERGLRLEEAMRVTFLCDLAGRYGLGVINRFYTGKSALRHTAAFYRVFMLREDLESHATYSARFRELAAKPYYEAKSGWEGLEEDIAGGPGGVMMRVLLPALTRAAASAARGDAGRRAALVGLAVCRYRARHGRFPEGLQDLAPEFIVAVPTDPFDGKPMKLKRTDHGLVVYSIGPDMTDDGGLSYDQKTKTGDVTFQVSVSGGPTSRARQDARVTATTRAGT